jgi:selenocysteine-specific elongation factor
MTVVIGTAGHIDHGKTTLLRALTGIDADRLPEERRRGMTIDVGYAHLAFDDGVELDFVDVPGHDKLVGNMLVGAGEIDAAMLVVAADDGPSAQTVEHLALLDALEIRDGLAVVTKVDAVDDARRDEVIDEVRRLLDGTSLAGVPVLAASSTDGTGIEEVRDALRRVSDAVAGRMAVAPARPPTLAIDRVFAVKGRGVVVTGTLRGGPLDRGVSVRVLPGDAHARARELQVHNASVEVAQSGRTAVNVAGFESEALSRGQVLTADPALSATDRMLVRLRAPLPDRTRARLHLGTAAVDAAVGRSGRDAIDLPDGTDVAAVLRLVEPVAAAPGDRFVLRRPSGVSQVVGGQVIDVLPAREVSRRRQTSARVAALAAAVATGDTVDAAAARLDLHGAVVETDGVRLAPDVAALAADAALARVGDGSSLAELRMATARTIRRSVTLGWEDAVTAASSVVDTLVRDGRLVRAGDRVTLPGAATTALDPAIAAAMDRLEAALEVVAPPALADAARTAGCPPEGIRTLERDGRIVVLEPTLAYAAGTYATLTAHALALATTAPLTPAALRDATGTSRRYVMAILEDLDRRGVLRRTPEGHRPGPRAAAASGETR